MCFPGSIQATSSQFSSNIGYIVHPPMLIASRQYEISGGDAKVRPTTAI